MSAIVVFHLGGLGGPPHSLLPVMAALAQRVDVQSIVPDRGPVAEACAALGPVAVGRYSALRYARGPRAGARLACELVRDVRSFRSAMRRIRPDLLVVVTTTLPAALLAARLERVPAVVYAAELYGQSWKRARLLPAWGVVLANLTARLASGIVCCSATVARQFPRLSRAPVVVAYPPIGTEYERGDRDAGRARYGVAGADPCVVVAGALSRGRGQDVALRAFASVRRRFPHARLLIAGSPHPRAVDIAYAEELRRLADDLDVADATVFAGATGRMPDVYAAADIVLNPARLAEAFGRVAAEALVAGRPVVSTRVGAVEEVIRDGVNGILVDPDDPEATADAVIRLWEDRALRDKLVAAGREQMLARFTEAASLAAWEEVLEGALPRGRSR